MEKVSHPSVDYNSDNSDIGSEVYSHDESDIVSGFSFFFFKKDIKLIIKYRYYTSFRAINTVEWKN